MKILKWIYTNSLFLSVLFLLVFIPLYPKLPLLGVNHTWVYIRAEDFISLVVLSLWLILLVRKKISIKTPLTMPILLFWAIGAIATLHGVLLIFPNLPNVFPHLALLGLLRRVEYLSMFFIAYSAMEDKKRALPLIIGFISITLFGVSLYGFGQHYIPEHFPAYLTMNEEFAKGTGIQLSKAARIPSTFGGHYDLAAYLVLVIPILASLLFGFRNWFVRLFLLLTIGMGFVVLFWTVSRISFFALLLAIAGVVFFHKKKAVLFAIPIVALLVIFVSMNFSSRLLDRFGNTVKPIDVLVDAKTGQALGNIKEVTPSIDYQDKIIRKVTFNTKGDIDADYTPKEKNEIEASISAVKENELYLMNLSENTYVATSSGLVPYVLLPMKGTQLVQPNTSTGENLPQGTGYANLALSPVKSRLTEFFYQQEKDGKKSDEILMFSGDFLVKTASAYDLSLTTRYQGEWPHAIAAFKRNVLFGSGYSSISLAIDNNYLRLLGEIGLLGTVSFFLIFIISGIYVVRTLPKIDSPIVRSFAVGFTAGIVGLAINATLIDVFEASKVAFYLWLLMGITIGVLHAYQTKPFDFYYELKKVATSTYAILVYLAVLCIVLYSTMTSNFFVGDDFTWLRWAATSHGLESIPQYFTHADGFFYRPGTKIYFQLMYSAFWLNPVAYHIASLFLHFIVVILVFFLAKKLLKDFKLAAFAAFLFATFSGYAETVFWISSVGHVFSGMFVLLSLLLFIYWEERKNIWLLVGSLLSVGAGLLFHELAVVAPLLMLLYQYVYSPSGRREADLPASRRGSVWFSTPVHSARTIVLLFSPVVLYLLARFSAHSHWSGGDYSYNLAKLPFNAVGNAIGYMMLSLLGPLSVPVYEKLRDYTKDHLIVAVLALVLLAGVIFLMYKGIKRLKEEDRKIIVFALLCMVISLLPFLGLGNIAPRYDYLVSFGFVLLCALFFKKIYDYLRHSGRDIAMVLMTLFLSVVFLLHVMQTQQMQNDWQGAGAQANQLFISIQSVYDNSWSSGPMDLYFVNVPVRRGEAWVFPVGLEDALWFIVQNPNMHVHQMQSVNAALHEVTDPIHQKVFVFDDAGNVKEKRKKLPMIINQ